MKGVASDQRNPYGKLEVRQYRSLGLQFQRVEIRTKVRYSPYIPTVLLYGPSTERFFMPPSVLQPLGVIIGNEPDYVPDDLVLLTQMNRNSKLKTTLRLLSTVPLEQPINVQALVSSWYMPPEQYIELYNTIAAQVPPSIPIIAAGMVGGPEYLQACWPYLNRKPDIVNKHYPNTVDEVVQFNRTFDRPVLVGETCYYTATTQAELQQWFTDLRDTSCVWGACWFCKDNAMVYDMGLYDYNKLTIPGRWFKSV